MTLDEYITFMSEGSRKAWTKLIDVDFQHYKRSMAEVILAQDNERSLYTFVEANYFLLQMRALDIESQLYQPTIFLNEPVDRCNTCLLVSYEFKFERHHLKITGKYGLMCPRCNSLDIDDIDE